MKCDSLSLDLALLNINLVTAKDDGNVLADADEIALEWAISLGRAEN